MTTAQKVTAQELSKLSTSIKFSIFCDQVIAIVEVDDFDDISTNNKWILVDGVQLSIKLANTQNNLPVNSKFAFRIKRKNSTLYTSNLYVIDTTFIDYI